jgi:hypothetical protein
MGFLHPDAPASERSAWRPVDAALRFIFGLFPLFRCFSLYL